MLGTFTFPASTSPCIPVNVLHDMKLCTFKCIRLQWSVLIVDFTWEESLSEKMSTLVWAMDTSERRPSLKVIGTIPWVWIPDCVRVENTSRSGGVHVFILSSPLTVGVIEVTDSGSGCLGFSATMGCNLSPQSYKLPFS